MRHQYTRAELESITQETAIYIEGAGMETCTASISNRLAWNCTANTGRPLMGRRKRWRTHENELHYLQK